MSLPERLNPYLQLVRLPALFSAWSNILAAHLIATAGAPDWRLLWLTLGITTAVYWAGMILNDCFDLAEDRRERPGRPLPSGRVPIPVAWGLGLGLLAAGLLLGLVAGGPVLWVTLLLIAAVLLYDGLLKRGAVAPFAMGACRYLNWLLGLAAAPLLASGLLLALPVFLYTVGVTTLSRIETTGGERRTVLVAGAWLLLAGISVVGLQVAGVQAELVALVALAMFLAVLGAGLRKIYLDPTPSEVQAGVKLMLVGMIPLDAILLAGDGQWPAALGLLLLMVPGRLLARRLYVT